MKNLLSFDEFVNEHYNVEETKVEEGTDADGFDPAKRTAAAQDTDRRSRN